MGFQLQREEGCLCCSRQGPLSSSGQAALAGEVLQPAQEACCLFALGRPLFILLAAMRWRGKC